MTRPLVRAVFALLVVATIGAFFLTQQLKGEEPLVLRLVIGRRFGGDTKPRFTWDGRDDRGSPVADGTYRMRVVRRDESRVIDSVKKITVDRKPPRVTLVSAEPSVIATEAPGSAPSVRLRYAGPKNKAPVFRVFRTGEGEPRIVRRFRGNRRRGAVWDGQVSAGPELTEPAPEGNYAFTVAVRDRAGNVTEAPLPVPRPSVARARTGVSVRNFTLRGPLSAVTAGAFAHLEVGPVDRSLDFVVSRLGDPKPVLRGGRIAGRFRIRIPSKMRTGVYVVRVRAGRERAVWPLAVAGLPPRSARGEGGAAGL